MHKTFFIAALLLLSSRAFADITIETVPVGNPGNAKNTNDLGNSPPVYGSVGYNYNIGKYDVTVGQYAAFLNAVAATDTYGLYNPSMATDLNIAGIAQNGSSGSYNYSVIGSANHPVTYVSWSDDVRFANWLANGQPTGAQGPGTTETGSYTLNGAITDEALSAVTRNPNASWVLPTENEWYKAAYYNAATSSYYRFSYSSNTRPTSAHPGNTQNTGNFLDLNGNYALTGSSVLDPNQNYLTDVGAYTASASTYGAFDMGGDVGNRTETLITFDFGESDRIIRGGSWNFNSNDEGAFDGYGYAGHLSDSSRNGFRVAFIPPNVQLSGDYNNDHHVDSADIGALELALTNASLYFSTYGLTNDDLMQLDQVLGKPAHTLDNSDLETLLTYLRSGYGSTNPVPEPCTLGLLAFGSIGLLARRRFKR